MRALAAGLVAVASLAPSREAWSTEGTRDVATDLPRQTGLQKDLEIDGEFGGIASTTVDAQGRIYVADFQMQEIRAFSPTGESLPTLGRNGRGPGEFRGIVSVVAGRGDTLFAFDVALQRITAFAPGAERKVAYTLTVPGDGNGRASYQVLVPSSGGFVLPYSVPHRPGASAEDRSVALRVVGPDGKIRPPLLLRIPDREALVTRTPGNGVMVGPLPYGREGFVQFGPGDRLFYGWNNTSAIAIYDLQGRRTGTLRPGGAPLSISGRDLDALRDSYAQGSPNRRAIEQAVSESRLPKTKPAYKGMVVDDRGNVWLNATTDDDVVLNTDRGLAYVSRQRLREGGIAPSPWWVVDGGGRRIASVTLPNNVSLVAVRGGKAYGVETDGDGVQRIVRYAVRT